MKWAVIGTWKMAYDGVCKAAEILRSGGTAAEAVLAGCADGEDNPDYHSVGLGGRPDRDGRVFLDGAFMDGDTLRFGAVAGLEGFRSPSRIAYALKDEDANNFLAGPGAALYARAHGFEERDNLTPEGLAIYEKEKDRRKKLSAYDGHDTICFTALDMYGSICTAVSTSGLFMKEPGRVGDSPVAGCGFYADSEIGGAAATGMGEEIMKGSLSFLTCRLMEEGKSPAEAADEAVWRLDRRLSRNGGTCRPMSVICLDHNGVCGAGTNILFPFAYASDEQEPALYIAEPKEGKTVIRKSFEIF
ncbi:MAG: N(4)-(beta-N-acetylglucosaminyl)-L-asparaginase [Solobacterium sp.]|nr:N(4)-(beta-N-acetylglucosaminyl)-L-asparaginase [Solobacterium sp.]